MKKLSYVGLLLCITVWLPLTCLGQTEKGSKLIGGRGSLQFNDPFMVSLSPNAGFFVKDRFALGSGLTASYSADGQANNKATSTSAGLSPFARYYFGQSALRYFLSAELSYTRSWFTYTFQQEKNARVYNIWDTRAGVGAVYFITPQIGLETLLSYGAYRISAEGANDFNRLQLGIGFQIYLPAK